MENKYTGLNLWNTLFEVRQNEGALVQQNKTANKIPFSLLEANAGLVTINFEVYRSNIAKSNFASREVTFLASVLTNTYDQNLALAPKMNKWSFEEGWNSTVLDEPLTKRIANELDVIVALPGIDFKLDAYGRVLKSVSHNHFDLDIRQMTLNRGKTRYSFYFNLVSLEQVSIDPQLKKMPSNVVKIEIPLEKTIDPVGMARKLHEPDTAYINEHPFKARHEATVIPLSTTYLLDQIQENKQRAAIGLPSGRLEISPEGNFNSKSKNRGKGIN